MDGTAPVASGGAAPASAPAAAAPVSTPAPAAASAPSPASTPDAGSSAPAASEAAPTSASSVPDLPDSALEVLEDIDWSSWDGTLDSIPEKRRGDYEPVFKHFTEKYADYDDVKAAKDRAERLYKQAVDAFGDDPRVDELQTQLTELTEQLKAAHTERDTHKTQLAAWREQEARSYGDRLAREYSKYFTDAAAKAQLLALLDDGFEDPEVAIQILELGEPAVVAAREAKRDGATDALAKRFAELRGNGAPKRPQPREAAKAMSGANPTSTPNAAPKGIGDAKTHNERVVAFAKKYASSHRTG